MQIYAVRRGRNVGIFKSWSDCEAQVKGFSNPQYRKFNNNADAERYLTGEDADTSVKEAGASTLSTSSGSNTKKRARETEQEIDETNCVIVYSDGACKGNGKANSIAGVGVWWGPDDPRNIAERCPGAQTNNRAELIAILRVLETTPETTKPLLIRTDSQYSIKCFRDWYDGWQKRGWKTSNGGPVLNLPIIRCIRLHMDMRAFSGQHVGFEYVKGHSGDTGNDGADHMANIGATRDEVPDRDWEEELRQLVKKWQKLTSRAREGKRAKTATDVPATPEKARKLSLEQDVHSTLPKPSSSLQAKWEAQIQHALTSPQRSSDPSKKRELSPVSLRTKKIQDALQNHALVSPSKAPPLSKAVTLPTDILGPPPSVITPRSHTIPSANATVSHPKPLETPHSIPPEQDPLDPSIYNSDDLSPSQNTLAKEIDNEWS